MKSSDMTIGAVSFPKTAATCGCDGGSLGAQRQPGASAKRTWRICVPSSRPNTCSVCLPREMEKVSWYVAQWKPSLSSQWPSTQALWTPPEATPARGMCQSTAVNSDTFRVSETDSTTNPESITILPK